MCQVRSVDVKKRTERHLVFNPMQLPVLPRLPYVWFVLWLIFYYWIIYSWHSHYMSESCHLTWCFQMAFFLCILCPTLGHGVVVFGGRAASKSSEPIRGTKDSLGDDDPSNLEKMWPAENDTSTGLRQPLGVLKKEFSQRAVNCNQKEGSWYRLHV